MTTPSVTSLTSTATAVDGSVTPTASVASSAVEASLSPTAPVPVTTVPEPTGTLKSLSIPPPQPGWAWYENEVWGFAVTYPDAWRQDGATFHAPDTNSQVQVRVHDIPAEADWLAWVRRNQERLIFTAPLAPELVEANAAVQGRPAYFRLAEGGGSGQILLVFPDGDRIIRFYLHSGTLPRLEAEMQIFRTMIENVVLLDGVTGETVLPTGWEQGGNLVIFSDETAEAAGTRQPYREISGLVTAANDPWTFTVATDGGEEYVIDADTNYYFQGLPVERAHADTSIDVAEGDRVTIVGLDLPAGRFRPEYLAIEQDGVWQPVFYKIFFDLKRETIDDAALLVHYPQDETIDLWLRGPWSDVAPYLLDDQGNPVTGLIAETGQEVLARGTWLHSVDTLQLVLTELYALVSDCVQVSGLEEHCPYWQVLYP